MKTLLLAATALVLMIGTASARDMGHDWSGAYVGVQGGWAFGRVSPGLSVPPGSNINIPGADFAISVGNTGFHTDGATFGIQAGYNWQNGMSVFGLEGDANYIDMRETNIVKGSLGLIGRSVDKIDANFFGSIRGRAGIQSHGLLFYATGGIAFTDAKFSRSLEWNTDPCPSGSTGLSRCHVGKDSFGIGYTVGGGIEFALNKHASIKTEYLYTNFGEAKFRTTSAAYADQYIDHSAKFDFHTIRIGLNYKF